jgi:hypothetical protein
MSSDRKPGAVEEAKEQLLAAAAELESIQSRLLEVHSALPAAPLEGDPLLEHLRTTISHTLEDQIAPALRLLRKTVGEEPASPVS